MLGLGGVKSGLCEKKSDCVRLCPGCGFSVFCKMNAQRFNVTGYAENLYDGTVLMEVEGKDYVVDTYLKTVAKGNQYIDVERMETQTIPLKEDRSFQIKY